MSVIAQEHGRGSEDAHVTKDITVTVNTNYKVKFTDHKGTGAGIKAAAIAQGVPNIQADFLVFELKGHDHQVPVGDEEEITLHKNQEFRIIADDDDS